MMVEPGLAITRSGRSYDHAGHQGSCQRPDGLPSLPAVLSPKIEASNSAFIGLDEILEDLQCQLPYPPHEHQGYVLAGVIRRQEQGARSFGP